VSVCVQVCLLHTKHRPQILGYLRSVIRGFTEIARPLTELKLSANIQTSYPLGKYRVPCAHCVVCKHISRDERRAGPRGCDRAAPGGRRSAPPRCARSTSSTSTVPRDVDALQRHLGMTSSNSYSYEMPAPLLTSSTCTSPWPPTSPRAPRAYSHLCHHFQDSLKIQVAASRHNRSCTYTIGSEGHDLAAISPERHSNKVIELQQHEFKSS
jgi:hypothetical protein